MRKASTELLEQGTQTPSPAPDLIPAEGKNQPRTHIGIGTVNGGTSGQPGLVLLPSTGNCMALLAAPIFEAGSQVTTRMLLR